MWHIVGIVGIVGVDCIDDRQVGHRIFHVLRYANDGADDD
jgi:hypothetical protein